MKATRILAILLAVLLTATVFGGCDKSDQPIRKYVFDELMYSWTDMLLPGDIPADGPETHCYDEETGEHKPDRVLVKATVLTPKTVKVTEREEGATFDERYDHLVEKPLRIEEVCHAGADVPLQAGDRIAFEKTCDVTMDPYTITEYFLTSAPLVEEYEFFIYLTYDPETGYDPYDWYPICEYGDLPHCTSMPAEYGRATRQLLIDKYGE